MLPAVSRRQWCGIQPRPEIRLGVYPGARGRAGVFAYDSSAEARCMLLDMSWVTMLCSSTAAAVEAMNSLTPAIADLMAVSDPATSEATLLSCSISFEIVSVACLA